MSPKDARDRRRYRKIFTRLWRNPAFRKMCSDEKVMALYVLSGPQTNRIGLFVLSLGEAAEDLALPIQKLRTHLLAVCTAFGWEFDAEERVIWIPSWWAFNDPKENTKAFQGALVDLNDVPPTHLLVKFCGNLADIPPALHPLMAKTLDEMGVRYPIDRPSNGDPQIVDTRSIPVATQEQEQEQEKEQEQEPHGKALLLLWNQTVKDLPQVQSFSADRLRHAKARLAEQPDTGVWLATFQRMDASDFLTGRKPSRENPSWRADIDFALKVGVAGKVMEGKYDNRAERPGPRSVPTYTEWVCQHVEPCENRTYCAHRALMPEKYPLKVSA